MPKSHKSKIAVVDSVATYAKIISNLALAEKHVRFFRGHDSQKYELKPSIFRNENFIKNERNFIREAMIRCPSEFHHSLTTFEVLVKLQHYGIPTRLLDLTANSLVALYFAIRNDSFLSEPGEVIVLDIPRDNKQLKYHDSDTVSILANLARRAKFSIADYGKNKESFNKEGVISKLIHDIRADKPGFEPKIKRNDLNKVLAVRTKLDNPRIIRQEGAFLIFGMGENKNEPAKVPSEWITTGVNATGIIIKQKEKIRRELNLFGVSEQSLFPELISQAEVIKKLFS